MAIFLLNFQRQFAPAVLAGEKCMTIRATRKDRKVPEVGDVLALYTGLRTRGAQLLMKTPATCVWRIRMDFEDRMVVVDGARLDHDAVRLLARSDGFQSVDAFFEFFRASAEGPLFEGFAPHWNPKERLQ